MIPSVIAREVRATVVDYLRTTLAISSPAEEEALFAFLEGSDGIFKGPFVDVRLPFLKAEDATQIPLDLTLSKPPYAHQLAAFQRLTTKDGHVPEPTLITTGTGSGKTECFLYPILDHCLRRSGEPGIKAILIYPMNALAADQARRVAQELQQHGLEKKVTAAVYVGSGRGRHDRTTATYLIDDRTLIRKSPPDILLTNYKMLDFLLIRPEDRGLWEKNHPETLRYLVLDELHTFDGAQGSDVACLIRRLRARLKAPPGAITCVGTSATLGSSKTDAAARLVEFASTLFGERFDLASVIQESRSSLHEVLTSNDGVDRFPADRDLPDLSPESFSDPATFLARQRELWLGDSALPPAAVATALRGHPLLRDLLAALAGVPRPLPEVVDRVAERSAGFAALAPEARPAALESFLALIAEAREEDPKGSRSHSGRPFLTSSTQLWIRELRRLTVRVGASDPRTRYAWADEMGRRTEADARYLPLAHCRDCGGLGRAARQPEGEHRLDGNISAIHEAFLKERRDARYLILQPRPELLEGIPRPERLCPRCLSLTVQPECPCAGIATIPVLIAAPNGDGRAGPIRCPDCRSKSGLGILGARAASLLSVAISHLFQSEYNDDPKLLAFTDSVQDASHRSAFFGARTFRFNVRTALQSVLEARGAPLSLAELCADLLPHWRARLREDQLIATFWPPDLIGLPEHQAYVKNKGRGDNRAALSVLESRLSWEATLEFGLQAHVGRTLERTGCASVMFPEQRLETAVARLAADIRERNILPGIPAPAPAILASFLHGILHRVRTHGGIFHPLLDTYLAQNGNTFFLRKRKNPIMSWIGPAPPTGFLQPSERHAVFDCTSSAPSSGSWYRDWAARALGIDALQEGINDLYRTCERRLVEAGLLGTFGPRESLILGLRPDALEIHVASVALRCSECARVVHAPEAKMAALRATPCPRFGCPGRLESAPEVRASYYRRIYRSGRLKRIFSAEHSSLLQREVREDLEKRFKGGEEEDPTAPNLVVATPTLEMGIDIGDLSAVLLTSIPPTPASFFQRIGRAGRRTGNAFSLSLANARPHDLYFYADPREMVSGEVVPPGCYLDAPYMLQRQLVAFAMDHWAAADRGIVSIPFKTHFVLGAYGKKTFPGRFLAHFAANKEAITDQFLAIFGPEIEQPENRARLQTFGLGGGVERAVEEAFERMRAELDGLGKLRERLLDRKRAITEDPTGSQDLELEHSEIDDSLRLVRRLIWELYKKYPLNVLTDEGVLPNYAFPEPGVTLKTVIATGSSESARQRRGARPVREKRTYFVREYVRPASSAIRELAPFNTFYAEGRQLVINEVDVGSKTMRLQERWRFCRRCHRMERADGVEAALNCPRCQDPGWSDEGQVRTMVHFRRAASLSDQVIGVAIDDRDDRESARYEVCDIIDVSERHWAGAQFIAELPFGVELLRNLTLREVNFGFDARPGPRFHVAGASFQEEGFIVCEDCGRVRNGKSSTSPEIDHAPYCRFKGRPDTAKTSAVFLYREIESEAIRLLLPVATLDIDESRASFKAALELGFRKRFNGRPSHLLIRAMSEPIDTLGQVRRNYLVVYDGVPGGTGYLAGLWKSEGGSGGGILAVLKLALDALETCACHEQGRDGCYRCLFAHQNQRELALISRHRAIELLREILIHRASLSSIATLSDVSLEAKVESELEARFLGALRGHAEREAGWSWVPELYGGKLCFQLATATGRRWRVEPQVDLGPREGVDTPTRPDFVLWPLGGGPSMRPIAVYCDGAEFHVCPDAPKARIFDDVVKRRAILSSNRFWVWSVTWKDLDLEPNPQKMDPRPSLFGSIPLDQVRMFLQQAKLDMPADIAIRSTFAALLHHLERPDAEVWKCLVRRVLAAALFGAYTRKSWPPKTELDFFEERLRRQTALFSAPHFGSEKSVPPGLAHRAVLSHAMLLVRGETERLKENDFEHITTVVRLFDEHACRKTADFGPSWNAALSAWNILQFHAAVDFVTSELLLAEGSEKVTTDDLRVGARRPNRIEREEAPDRELSEVFQLLRDDQCRRLVEAVRASKKPLPEVGEELEAEHGRVIGQTELLWRAARVAVLRAGSSQADEKPVLEAHGYRVFLSDVSAEELVRHL